MSVLSRFQKPHANVVMCMLLNGPQINVDRTLWVAKSRFFEFASRNALAVPACFGGVDSSY